MEISLESKSTKVIFTDLQIIEGIKTENNEKIIRTLQNQFYHKYKGYVYKVTLHSCIGYHDSQQFAIDITQQTFINALKKIKDFDLSKEKNQDKHQYLIKAWLGRIALNCFKKEYAKRKDVIYLDDLTTQPEDEKFDLFESLYGDETIEVSNEFRTKLNAAMNLLTKEQKHILLVHADEECLNNSLHLSDEAMEYLCKTYNTSSANIRQIKKRALDKIKDYCFNK
jgi:RNA polymerase sigma factor (sigma-70 family)